MPGKKFLSTDAPTTGASLVWKAIQVHSDPVEIQALVSGAISLLYESYNFEQFGSMTPDEMAEYFLERDYVTNICTAIANCIASDESVKQALTQFMGDSGLGVPPNGIDTNVGSDSPLGSNENILTGSACDVNSIAGECVAIVDQLDLLGRDYVEQFSASTLPGEIAVGIIENTPLIGHLSPGDAAQYIDWFSDEVLTQYLGSVTQALKDEAACLLYEQCCDDCELTLDEMNQAFFGRVGIGFDPVKTWQTVIGDLVSLSLGSEVVYGVWCAILSTWKAGGLFLGSNSTRILQIASSRATPVDPATLGCNPCQQPQSCDALPITATYSGGTTLPCVTAILGTITDGAGQFGGYAVQETTVNNLQCDARVRIDLPAGVTVASLSVEHYNFADVQATQGFHKHRYYDSNDNLLYEEVWSNVPQGWTTRTSTHDAGSTAIAYVNAESGRTIVSGSLQRDTRVGDMTVS